MQYIRSFHLPVSMTHSPLPLPSFSIFLSLAAALSLSPLVPLLLFAVMDSDDPMCFVFPDRNDPTLLPSPHASPPLTLLHCSHTPFLPPSLCPFLFFVFFLLSAYLRKHKKVAITSRLLANHMQCWRRLQFSIFDAYPRFPIAPHFCSFNWSTLSFNSAFCCIPTPWQTSGSLDEMNERK